MDGNIYKIVIEEFSDEAFSDFLENLHMNPYEKETGSKKKKTRSIVSDRIYKIVSFCIDQSDSISNSQLLSWYISDLQKYLKQEVQIEPDTRASKYMDRTFEIAEEILGYRESEHSLIDSLTEFMRYFFVLSRIKEDITNDFDIDIGIYHNEYITEYKRYVEKKDKHTHAHSYLVANPGKNINKHISHVNFSKEYNYLRIKDTLLINTVFTLTSYLFYLLLNYSSSKFLSFISEQKDAKEFCLRITVLMFLIRICDQEEWYLMEDNYDK